MNTRQDKKKIARRQEILAAAGQLFAERGYHRTTTRDIALAADISEGTIYNYFASKEDLLMGIMEQLTASMHLEDMLGDSHPEDPQEFLGVVLRNRGEYLKENGILLQAILSEILVNPELARQYYREIILPTQERIEAQLTKRIETGQMIPVESAHLGRIITGLITGLYFLEIVGDRTIMTDWDDISVLVIQVLFNGIGTGSAR